MLWTQRAWMGAAAGAGASVLWGDRDEDLGDRAQKGALLGGVAGVGLPIAARYGTKPAVQGTGRTLGRYAGRMGRNFTALRQEGVGFLHSGWRAFGTVPMMMGAGAAIGAAVDSDDRGQGALIGAGVGAAARLGYHGYQSWKAINTKVLGMRPGRGALIAGVSALAYMAGSSMAANQTSAVASPTADGGYQENAPGSPLPEAFDHNEMLDAWGRESGLKSRLQAMNASGNIVLGSHHRRRR